jgi:acetyl/propionyl-CoA carboxylase alpha subunit
MICNINNLFLILIGYPVLLKAEHGGGGKGMRIVLKESEMEEAIQSCMNIYIAL